MLPETNIAMYSKYNYVFATTRKNGMSHSERFLLVRKALDVNEYENLSNFTLGHKLK